jgi:hypothetical protein
MSQQNKPFGYANPQSRATLPINWLYKVQGQNARLYHLSFFKDKVNLNFTFKPPYGFTWHQGLLK